MMTDNKPMPDVAQILLKTAENLVSLADSVRAMCAALADSSQGQEKVKPEKETRTITLEEVRGVLAERSREGYTAGVRSIIQSFGVERLSEIDPSHYEEILKRAEELPYA